MIKGPEATLAHMARRRVSGVPFCSRWRESWTAGPQRKTGKFGELAAALSKCEADGAAAAAAACSVK